ncbi:MULTISPECIES: hypothetical protein [Bacillaceae]|uniref:Alpha/beta hydrolase n=1 Tax=Evansella alkalicola TaxID=745819 RepID=A0ABS6JTC0_9BACI|nr:MULTISPECIES: hypothetical protein [Bacillaceae]MBU9721806.1 hypothetical protein [Bacillus alkalicola]
MTIKKRLITIENEECLLHLPEKPNGYAILILGDRSHYIHGEDSYWTQHPTRKELLEGFVDKGYTVFYSHQSGAHWGKADIAKVTVRLINYALKTEILNQHIHIIAEGMGALIALRLLADKNIKIRSSVFINPCISITNQLEEEEINRFFYKKMVKELIEAYNVGEEELELISNDMDKVREAINPDVPIRILQAVYQAPYSMEKQTRVFIKERKDKQKEIDTTFYLPGKTINQFIQPICFFFVKYEQ